MPRKKRSTQTTKENSTVVADVSRSFADEFRKLDMMYGDLDLGKKMKAVLKAGRMFNSYTADPNVQNRRVKNISSLPVDMKKQEITDALKNPNGSEIMLRQLSNILEYTAYPMFKLRKTYQDILTYRYYSFPAYVDESEAKTEKFLREWRLIDKLNAHLRPSDIAHEITGQCVRDGKVFYILRSNIDKAHNDVNHCFLQQLPQDWVKIAGVNNVSKYSVAFNMMYFLQPGATWSQFGDLFRPYKDGFLEAVRPVEPTKQIVYASKNASGYEIDRSRLARLSMNESEDGPEVYSENGTWFYWVNLPADAVWTFEADDVSRNVISPLIGLALSMAQIAQYEEVQLELVQNPLVACVLGEMEYRDDTAYAGEDAYKLSPSGRAFFESLWYQMLSANNTGGIGIYSAPLKNLHLEQLAEAPSATEVSSKGYAYAMMKSGNGILPMDTEPRAGSVQISAMIEAQYARGIYGQFERMMNYFYGKLKLNYEWRFRMFGNIFSEETDLENCRKGMTLGILSDTLKYDAMMGHSLLEDMSMSNALLGIGIMDKRLPLTTSYTMTNKGGNPGNEESIREKKQNPSAPPVETGGRPEAEGAPDTEGQEGSEDAGY